MEWEAVARKAPGNARYVLILFLLNFAVLGIYFSFGVFFTPMLQEFGQSRAATAWVFSAHSLVGMVVQLVAGHWTDRFGAPRILLGCALAMGTGLMALFWATSLWQFYLIYGLAAGIGIGLAHVPVVTAIGRYFGSWQGLALGLVTAGTGLGTLVISSLSGWLVETIGWRTAYLLYGAAVLAVGVTGALLLLRAERAGLLSSRRAPGAAAAADGWRVGEAVRTPQVWGVIACTVVFYATGSAVLVHAVPHGIKLGLPPAAVAVAFGLAGLGRIAGSLGTGFLLSRWAPGRVLQAAMLAVALCPPALLLVHSLAGVTVVGLLFGVAYSAGIVAVPVLTLRFYGARDQGAIFALVNVGFGLGNMLGPYVAGLLFDLHGSYAPAFAGAGAAGVAAALALSALRTPVRRQV